MKFNTTSKSVLNHDKNKYEGEHGVKRYLEKHLFNKNINNIINCKKYYNDKFISTFLHETEIDIEGKSSKFTSSVKSSLYLGSLCTSDLRTNVSGITSVSGVKSVRNFNDNISKLITEDAKKQNVFVTYNTPMKLTSQTKLRVDKSTYCQPVVHFNQEFVFKTMEKNNKLKKLVKRLLMVRQEEKDSVTWNNYINELKNKHHMYSDSSRVSIPVQGYEKLEPEMIEDLKNTKYSWKHSIPCSNLLEELYDINSLYQQMYKQNNRPIVLANYHGYIPFNNNLYCYPTSSRGRNLMLEREKQKRERKKILRSECSIRRSEKFINRNICNTYFRDIKSKSSNDKQVDANFVPKYFRSKKMASTSNQTNLRCELLSSNTNSKNLILNSKSVDVEKDSRNIFETTTLDNDGNRTDNSENESLTNIETKLETLIESLNKYINEIKNRNEPESKSAYVSCKLDHIINSQNKTNSYEMEPSRHQNLVYNVATNSSGSTVPTIDMISQVDHLNGGENFKYIASRGISKSKYLERQINTPCSVEIQFEIPTKDCCIEVKKSLSNQGGNDINAIGDSNSSRRPPNGQITMAINTDPLSVFSLLRMSTDTLRKFLSYMPNINYYWYLSMLPFANVLKHGKNHNVCNICGAVFEKPSQLSDHIQGHNLEKTKDCCVCRHVLDRQQRLPGYFTCEYCGQKFTRAYCCELHQQTCATRMGRGHDVSPSLSIPR